MIASVQGGIFVKGCNTVQYDSHFDTRYDKNLLKRNAVYGADTETYVSNKTLFSGKAEMFKD